MLINVTASFCFFIVIIILILNFNSKKRLLSLENNVFKHLSNICAIGLLIEFIDYLFFIFDYDIQSSIIIILGRIIFMYYILFMYYFILYVYITCNNIKEKDKKYNNFVNILSIIYIIFGCFVIVLPFEFVEVNNSVYPVGLLTNFSYLIGFMGIAFIFFICIYKFKFLKQKKSIPIFCGVVGAMISVILQFNFHELLLLIPIHAITILIMYFTIENPDMKMLDEVYKAKEISDNANEEKELFIFNLTQDIRSISNDIDNDANKILNSNKLDETHEYARQIKKDATKFTTMTNEIFDISLVDSSNIKTYDNKYNIKLLFKELIKIYKIESENKNIKFVSSIETDIPEYLYGDNINLRKVLTILLDNAIKNTNDGSIEFNVSTIRKKDICRLIITIEDTGIGMTPQELNNILTKKEESDEEKLNVNDTVYNAKKIITLMGGTLIPSSVINVGTKIKVVLDQKIVKLDKDIDKYSKIYDKKKIAIVDNNESSIKIFKKLLNNDNLIIDIFNYGEELLDKVRSNEKYDIVLLAEEIEPLNAFEILNKLKEVNNFNSKVVLVSRNNNYEYDEEYKEYGFNDCLIKPIDKDKLIKVIND